MRKIKGTEPLENYELYFELTKLPPSLNQIMRGGWKARYAIQTQFKKMAASEILGQKKPASPLVKYQIIFTRHTTSPLDGDNLAASFKPIMDSLTINGIIQDDKWGMTENVSYKQTRVAKRTQHKISVEVKDLSI